MTLTDVAVRRPVLAFVASALIIVFGFMGLRDLPLREMPDVDRPVVHADILAPAPRVVVLAQAGGQGW